MDSRHRASRHRRVPSTHAESVSIAAHDGSHGIDPGRLIETAFRSRCPADDPETYVIAWLAVLRAPADAPCAAAMLGSQLRHLRVGILSPWQRRLIELLDFVAGYRRRRYGGELCSIKPTAKKGIS